MDLRAIVNNDEGASGASRPSSMAASQASAPATPLQAPHQPQLYSEYGHALAQGKHPSQDFRGQPQFVSPNQYQSPGPYPGRPSQPPALQISSRHPMPSPGTTSQYSAQSPSYRNIPPGSVTSGYPFPQNNTPISPAQQHSYSTSSQHRDSYPPANPTPPTHLKHSSSHSSYGQPSPQTPTIGVPGQPSPYLTQHQRSQSSHSNSTPTPTHGQQQAYAQYSHPHFQESPLSGHAYPPQQQPSRQQSQPGTPLGPPVSLPRQASGGFQHPTSPYQHRPPSSGMIAAYPQASPSQPQPPHYTQQRQPSVSSAYGSHRGSYDEQHRDSYSSRERSSSVSPKTVIQPLPRTEVTPQPQIHAQYPPRPAQSIPSPQQQQAPPPPLHQGLPAQHHLPLQPHLSSSHQMPSPSMKRKMDDRGSSEPRSTTPSMNGNITSSPHQRATKKQRSRYTEPPVWARSIRALKHGNVQIKRETPPARSHDLQSTNGHGRMNNPIPQPVAPMAARAPPQAPATTSGADNSLLGPWEASISGRQPTQELANKVADWLFIWVVNRHDSGELKSRGVEIEIEAKLGQLIDQDTNQRVYYPIATECVLEERSRVTFRSSMTEGQHKKMNDYLNNCVVETDHRNPAAASFPKPRVPIVYTHRRERDSFHELPQSEIPSLPAAIRDQINKRHALKVRVTHDQRTGEVLAKIIKVRVKDLNMYLPNQPYDCRISINLEMRYDGDIEGLGISAQNERQPERNKDRLSYKQNNYQVDLTQVTTADPAFRAEKEHELELELDAQTLVEQGTRARNGQEHRYAELVEGFVNNIRVLARAVPNEG